MQARTPPEILRRTSLWPWLGVALGPFLLTVVVLTIFYRTVGLTPVPRAPTGVYAVGGALVVVLVGARLSPAARAHIVPLRTPGTAETVAAILVAAGTIFVFDPVATTAAGVLGGEEGSVGSFDSLLGVAIFGASAVLIGPVVEEALFRGLALDAFRVRYGAAIAILGSSALFGGVHLVTGGVSGVVSASLSGLLYAGLRVRYENLVGAIVAHALNNVYWMLVMLGTIPNLVPA